VRSDFRYMPGNRAFIPLVDHLFRAGELPKVLLDFSSAPSSLTPMIMDAVKFVTPRKLLESALHHGGGGCRSSPRWWRLFIVPRVLDGLSSTWAAAWNLVISWLELVAANEGSGNGSAGPTLPAHDEIFVVLIVIGLIGC